MGIADRIYELVFADTNIVVYAFADDDTKVVAAEGILEKQANISVQVVNEFLNVCRIKLGLDLTARIDSKALLRRIRPRGKIVT